MKPVPPAPHDPISDVIALLRPRTVSAGYLRATGPWALAYESLPHVKIGTVVRGSCWLSLEGREPVLLERGDLYALGNPPRYVMGSSVSAQPLPADEMWATAVNGVLQLGPERADDTLVCGGYFSFDDANASLLLDAMPTLVHLSAGDTRSKAFAHLSELLVAEVDTQGAGGSLVVDHLTQILLVHMLRAQGHQAPRPTGWLGALGDKHIGPALRAMHGDVAHRWTLEGLARIAGMSRAGFAASFKRQVGRPPLDYLIQWRMSLARDALRHDTKSISELAFEMGYESESAFSTAFRRVVGASPRQFRAAR